MTKSWEDVREQVCQLYLSGRPLREIRERLERERNFTASQRAFRMKLKEWKVKRSKCPGDCSEHVQEAREVENGTTLSQYSYQPQGLTSSLNTPAQVVPASMYYNNSRNASFATPIEGSLHDLYLQFQLDNSMSNVRRILAHAGFDKTLECILHYAAARQHSSILGSIVKFAKLEQLDINVKDENGHSALEVAIRSRKLLNVELLLKAGASLQCNLRGETALHVALLCRADWHICDLLLRFGADSVAPLRSPEGLKTPLELAIYDDDTQSLAEAENQIGTIRTLLHYGATYHPLDDSGAGVHKCILQQLRRYLLSACDPTPAFMTCFRKSLESGSNLMKEEFFLPSGCTCHTIPRVVFHHFRNTGLPYVLVDSVDLEKHGRHLVESVLIPCEGQTLRQGSIPPHAVLEMLRVKHVTLDTGWNPFFLALEASRKEDFEALVTTLLKFDRIESHGLGWDYADVLSMLPTIDLPVRWQLAERILDQDLVSNSSSIADEPSNGKVSRILVHDFQSSYHKYSEPAFRILLTAYLSESFPLLEVPDTCVEECLRCVIHVVTKHIIDDTTAASLRSMEKGRLIDALEMRRRYRLPDLELSNEFLLCYMRGDLEIDERGSHKNVHRQTRSYFCPVEGCKHGEGSNGFKRKNEMNRHALLHKSPGFTCPFCPDREHKYPRPDNLQRHVRAYHMDKDSNDPLLREVLAQRNDSICKTGRRQRRNISSPESISSLQYGDQRRFVF